MLPRLNIRGSNFCFSVCNLFAFVVEADHDPEKQLGAPDRCCYLFHSFWHLRSIEIQWESHRRRLRLVVVGRRRKAQPWIATFRARNAMNLKYLRARKSLLILFQWVFFFSMMSRDYKTAKNRPSRNCKLSLMCIKVNYSLKSAFYE